VDGLEVDLEGVGDYEFVAPPVVTVVVDDHEAVTCD
jgi:hypothetical protein